MFKKFPSYFSVVAAIIFILTGLFINLTPYSILVGVVVVLAGSYVLGSIIRIFLESVFPEPEPPEEDEVAPEEPSLDDSTLQEGERNRGEIASDNDEERQAEFSGSFSGLDNTFEQADKYSENGNTDETEE